LSSDVIFNQNVIDDLNNVLVLSIFAGSLVAVILGYLLAWRAKRMAYRRAGSLMTAAVAGFAGLLILAWSIGAVMPPPDGTPLGEDLVFLLVLLPLPVGAFYVCAKFIRKAGHDERK
jgi:membrane protein DedA with SNARE-associated domain